jgi:hypothetical protein
VRRFGKNSLISLIVFVQNTSALGFDTLMPTRVPIVVSRRDLEERFGAAIRRKGSAGNEP